MTLEPGTTLGRYQILAALGHGGMASVYKAFQPALDRIVALKVLRPGFADDPEFLERFEREAKAVARLRHPNIVQVFDFDTVEGRSFIVMEHLEGGTLKSKLADLARTGQRLPPAEAARIVGEVAEALDAAHAQGVVHRDVKPSNILLTRSGKAVVSDFGIAKVLAATQRTQTGVGVGTPEYMSPEQGQGQPVDQRSDVYSLGVAAYELLVGRVPFTAETPLAVVLAHLRDPLPLPSKIDPSIGRATEQVLLRALAKDPAARYESAGAFAQALGSAIAHEAASIPRTLVRRPPASRAASALPLAVPRLPARQLLAGAVAVVLVAGGLVAVNAARDLLGAVPAATASAAPSASAAPPLVKGDLLWSATLDARGPDIRSPYFIQGDPTAVEGDVSGGALRLAVLKEGGSIAATFEPLLLNDAISEVELAFDKGARSVARWIIRSGAGGNLQARLLAASDELEFAFYDSALDRLQKIGRSLPVSGMSDGRRVVLSVVATAPRYALYLDGALVGEFTDDRLRSIDRSRRSIGLGGSVGAITVTAARVSALPTAAAPSAPSPTATPAPLRKGVLLWNATLDLNGADLGKPYTIGDAAASSLRTLNGVLELAVLRSAGNTGVPMTRNLPTTFVGEIEFSVRSGSDVTFWWTVHPSAEQKRNYQIEVDSLGETARLARFDPTVPGPHPSEVLGGPVPVPGLQTGRAVRIGVAVEQTRYRLYVDGALAAEASGLAPAQQGTPFSFATFGRSGTVTVSAVRAYALPLTHTSPARGALVFEASLDGTPRDIRGQRDVTGNAADSAARFLPGAIELSVLRQTAENAGTSVILNMPTRRAYVAELDLAFTDIAGRGFSQWMILRRLPQGTGIVAQLLPDRGLTLVRYDNVRGINEDLTPSTSIDGLSSGRVVTIAALVEELRITLYLDEKQVAQAGVLPPIQADSLQVGVSSTKATGTLRILGVRVYELP